MKKIADRPVSGEPGTVYEYDEGGQPFDPSVGWDLSNGCRVTFGLEGDQLVALVTTSGKDQRDGITRRSMTREQVEDFARQLSALIGK